MHSVINKILAVLFGLFLLLYVGYQALRYIGQSYKTEVAYAYTAADSVQTTGIIIRDEKVLSNVIDENDIVRYMKEDGTKLSLRMTIAEIYQSREAEQTFQQLYRLEDQIAALEYAQNPVNSSYAQAEQISKQIIAELGQLTDHALQGNTENASAFRQNLTTLLNQKQVATGKTENFDALIAQLSAQRDALKGHLSASEQILSNTNGYFCKTVDGYEDLIQVSNMHELTPETYRRYLSEPQPAPQGRLGKFMLSQNWYLGILAEGEELAKFKIGASVSLRFSGYDMADVDAVVYDIIADADATEGIVLIKCDYISKDLINMRIEDVNIRFRSYTGLKIDESAIRFVDNVPGVYIISNKFMLYKKIDIIYEGTGFVLCQISSDKDYVQQFDHVVTAGTELYDGKPV